MNIDEDDDIHEKMFVVSENTWTVKYSDSYADFHLRPTGNGLTAWLTGGFAIDGGAFGVYLSANELRELAKVALNIAASLDENESEKLS